MYKDVTELIATTKPESIDAGFNEIFVLDNKSKVKIWLDKGIAVVSLSKGFDALLNEFGKKPPVFLQHIFPVMHQVEINSTMDDLYTILQAAKDLMKAMDINKSFSVQCRLLNDITVPYSRHTINEVLSSFYTEQGFELNVTNPEKVISVVIVQQYCFIGLSNVDDNLSRWSGGQHRFAREIEQITRSEFKLLEAIDYFNISLPHDGLALDLGAAPGGWTRVLLNHSMKVFAVDPATLDESLANEQNIEYFGETAQTFFDRDLDIKFDLIVNDMKMDAKESSYIVGNAVKFLADDGVVILTLKLPKTGMLPKYKESLKILNKYYKIAGARQLFHNRSEVTIVLKKQILHSGG